MAKPSTYSVLGQDKEKAEAFTYKAFLSYSHKDEVRAARLHRRLERYRIPKNLRQNGLNLGTIFRDKEELSAASELDKSIQRALTDSENLIVLCSPHAVRSQWVDKEIEFFKSLGRILSGIPNAKNRGFPAHQECLPKSLRYDLSETGDITAERGDPLATDLRSDGDGKRLGLIKLVSGLMGLRLDQFLQRQLTHARRRMMGILVTSSALISIFAGLAWATHSAQLRAEARQADAENFVEFLLSDLSLQLETYGRLDLLDRVGVKAVDYYAQFEENELDAQTKGLVADPNNPDRVYEHARSAYFKSLPLRRMVNYPAELIQLEEFSELSERLAALEGGSPRSLEQLGLVAMNIGRVKLRMNERVEALQYLTKADALFQELNAAEPSIENFLLQTENLAWLAEYHKVLEDNASNFTIRERQNALIDERLTLHPDDFRLIEASVYAKIGLAGAANYLGEKVEGKRHANAALKGTETALRLEPRREKMRRAKSIILYSLMKEAVSEKNEADFKRAEAKLTKLTTDTLRTSTDENKYWDEVLPGLIAGLEPDFD